MSEAPGRDAKTVRVVRVGTLVEQILDDRQPVFVTAVVVVARGSAGVQQAALAPLAPLRRRPRVEEGAHQVDGAPPRRPADAVVGPRAGLEQQQAGRDAARRTIGAGQVEGAGIPHRAAVDKLGIGREERADAWRLTPLAGEQEILDHGRVHRAPDALGRHATIVARQFAGQVVSRKLGNGEDIQRIRKLQLETRPVPRGLALVPSQEMTTTKQGIHQRVLVEPAVRTQQPRGFATAVETGEAKSAAPRTRIGLVQPRPDARYIAETCRRLQIRARAQQIGETVRTHFQRPLQGRLRGRTARPGHRGAGRHEHIDDLPPMPPDGMFKQSRVGPVRQILGDAGEFRIDRDQVAYRVGSPLGDRPVGRLVGRGQLVRRGCSGTRASARRRRPRRS